VVALVAIFNICEIAVSPAAAVNSGGTDVDADSYMSGASSTWRRLCRVSGDRAG
jgi:hypothetical protein